MKVEFESYLSQLLKSWQ